MSEMNLNERIYELRREREWTQEQLAQKLGVSYQAVSKWENAQACPDISLLPAIADLFEVSIDSLFGREKQCVQADLPWEDDQAFHLAIYAGRRLVSEQEIKKLAGKGEVCTVRYAGEARDVHCLLNLLCEADVQGSVQAGGGVTCSGDVGGSVQAGAVTCGDVGGSVEAGAVTCGDVAGDVHSGSIKCGDIEGDVTSDSVKCGDIEGNVQAAGDVNCGDVGGSVQVKDGGDVNCGDVEGDVVVKDGGSMECGDVNGNVQVNGKLTCDEISGSVTYTTPDGKPADGAKVVTHRMQKVRHEWKTDDGRELSVEWYAPRKDKDKDEGDSDEDDDNE